MEQNAWALNVRIIFTGWNGFRMNESPRCSYYETIGNLFENMRQVPRVSSKDQIETEAVMRLWGRGRKKSVTNSGHIMILISNVQISAPLKINWIA